jgi:hypothetical protein
LTPLPPHPPICRYIFILEQAHPDQPNTPEVEEFKEVLAIQYMSATIAVAHGPITRNRLMKILHIADLTDKQCFQRTMFCRDELERLYRVLRLDELGEFVQMSNGSRFGTEEIMIIALHRFSYPIRFTDMVQFYGRDWSALSRAFNWFSKYVRTNFSHLIIDNMQYWKPCLEEFTEVVREKMIEKSDGGVVYPPGSLSVFGFVDDTVTRTTRPGGGPVEGGVEASRHNCLIQMAFYSGYKKCHGVKYQTLELPNGLCMDLYGPISFRRNDIEVCDESHLNEKLEELSADLEKQYKVYCDGIFTTETHMLSKHVGETTRAERYENGVMTKIRIANEWAYGITENLFTMLKFSNGLQIRRNFEHSYYYVTATILRNAHCCLCGNQISQYFDCVPPSLENYFQLE